jgi:hypothetical protein
MNSSGMLSIHCSMSQQEFGVFIAFRSDAEKCLQSMIDNVTLQKALQALIAGGAR